MMTVIHDMFKYFRKSKEKLDRKMLTEITPGLLDLELQ